MQEKPSFCGVGGNTDVSLSAAGSVARLIYQVYDYQLPERPTEATKPSRTLDSELLHARETKLLRSWGKY